MRRTLALLITATTLVIGTTACDETALLTEQVFFDVGSDILTQEAEMTLVGVVQEIRDAGASGTVVLAGHADDQGDDALNQDLSERRAASVRMSMEEMLVGTETNIRSEGYGSDHPQAPNDSDDNRAQNRRVEITYWP